MPQQRSVFSYLGENVSNHCGYCKVEAEDKYTHGMWAHRMTVEDYQALIDRGWRRSGQYCYKPTMDKTCCPQYTIRCEAESVGLRRSQKRVLRRVAEFLRTGERPANADRVNAAAGYRTRAETLPPGPPPLTSDVQVPETPMDTATHLSNATPLCNTDDRLEKDEVRAGKPAEDPSLVRGRPVLKRKERRRQRKLAKLAEKGRPLTELEFRRKEPVVKSLEERLRTPVGAKHKLELRLVAVSGREWEETLGESHSVYASYQTRVHGDPPEKPDVAQYRRFLADSPLRLRLLPSAGDLLASEASLFAAYQRAVHGDEEQDCDEDQFRDFLVQSPLLDKEGRGEHPGFGSFHQQYWLDGVLVGVGVLDLLPLCISSVYLFYDPDYAFLNLGTYSALQFLLPLHSIFPPLLYREIALTRRLMRLEPRMRFYYMGYYIHSCPKMRYKVFDWHPIAECARKLDKTKYSRFQKNLAKEDKGKGSARDTLILYGGQAMEYPLARAMQVPLNEEVAEYAKLVGKEVASRALLHIRDN